MVMRSHRIETHGDSEIMEYLSEAAKRLIGRIDNTLLLSTISNLADCVNQKEEFFLPTAKLQAAWFEQEVEMLDLRNKTQLIKDMATQALANMETAK